MKLYYNSDDEGQNSPNPEEKSEHVLQGHDIRVETKNQKEKMKDKPFKEKLGWFFEYYKFHVLGVVVGIIALYSIVHAVITSKDYSFSSMIINSSNIDSEITSELFSEYASLDQEKYNCYIDANEVEKSANSMITDTSVSTRFAAMISSKDLDVIIYDSKEFYEKSLSDFYMDLSTVLSEDDLERFKDNLYYVDRAEMVRAETDETIYNEIQSIPTDYNSLKEELKKHQDPSSMEDPVLVGIVIEDSPFVVKTDCYFEKIPVFAIAINTQRLDAALSFLHFIYEEDIDFTSARIM